MVMEIRDVAELSSFVVIEASWPVTESYELIEELAPRHVIVHRAEDAQDYYYLFEAELVLAELKAGVFVESADRRNSVYSKLGLSEHDAVPLIAASEDAAAAPDRCIVHEEGRIIGLFDADDRLYGDSWLYPGLPDASFDVSARRRAREQVEAATGLVTRYLTAEFPMEVKLDVPVSLLVSISGTAVDPQTMPIALSVGAMIDIVVQPLRRFAIEGPAEASLQVGTEEPLPVQFKVRGTSIGPGELRVLAFHRGQPLSVVTLRPLVVDQAARSVQTSSHSGPLAPVSVRVPDLMLLIEERDVGGRPGFMLRLHAPYLDRPHNLTPFGPIVLQTDAFGYFDAFFKEIQAPRLDDSTARAIAEEQLKAKGAKLFERLFPSDLRKIIWDLRNGNLVMQVQSEEPWVPWELCRLFGEIDGDIVDGPFLCEAFAVARWQPGIPFKSPLKLTNVALVVPADSGLPLAPVERDAILALADANRRVSLIPANFLEIQRALKSGTYDGWHFTGHGAHLTADPNKAQILLEKRQPFTPDNLAGEIKKLGLAQPLVFLNACHTGIGGMSLTGIGGWAREFLASGAGAFIGSYWEVYDRPACDFALALYTRLLGGEPIGKAVQGARAAIRNSGDPTWLAYTVFADPTATLARA
jgi:hypothetical protein